MMFSNHGAAAVNQSYMISEIGRLEAMIQSGVPVETYRLQTIWDAGKVRREKARRRQEMYENDWQDQLEEELEKRFRKENFKKLKLMSDFSLNILRWVVRKVAGPYKKPAVRTIDGQEDKRLTALHDESDMHLVILEATRLLQLHKEVLLGPYCQTVTAATYDEEGREITKAVKRIRYRILTPDACEVITRPGEPNVMLALLYTYMVPDEQGYDHIRYVYWDDNHCREYDEQWQEVPVAGNPHGLNPYGTIPFTPWHAEMPTDRFWHGEQGNGLERANLNIGCALTDFWHALKHNSYKQLALSGNDLDDLDLGMLLDPSAVADLGVDGKADILDMTVNFMQNIEAIWQVASMILHMYGISPKTFQGKTDGQSGYALEIQERDLVEVHDEQRLIYPSYERENYRVLRAVNNQHPEFEELPEGVLEVSYDEIGPGQSPEETADYQIKLVDAKLTTHVQAIMAIHACDEEKAEEIWAAIQEEDKALSPMPTTPMLDFGDIEEPGEDDEDQDPTNPPRSGSTVSIEEPGDTNRMTVPTELLS